MVLQMEPCPTRCGAPPAGERRSRAQAHRQRVRRRHIHHGATIGLPPGLEVAQININKPLWTCKPEDVVNEECAALYKHVFNEWEIPLAVPESTPMQDPTPEESLHEREQFNTNQPLWMRNPEDVTYEEYFFLYKSMFNDWEDHLAVKHFRIEGRTDFHVLLFVPRRAPNDLLEITNKHNNIQLYVRRFIMLDDFDELIPAWLNFITGVVDSADLPPNMYHETLAQDKILRVLKKHLVTKCLDMYAEMAETKDDNKQFWGELGTYLKLGTHVASTHRTSNEELMCYHTSTSRDEISRPKARETADTCYAGTDAPSITDSSAESIPVVILDAIYQALDTEMTRHSGTSEEIACLAVERAYDATVSHSFWDQVGALMAVNGLAIEYIRDLDYQRGLH